MMNRVNDLIRQGWRVYRITLRDRDLSSICNRLERDVMYDEEKHLLFVR